MLSLTVAAPRLFITSQAARSLERHLKPFQMDATGGRRQAAIRPVISPAGFARALVLWAKDTAWQEAFDTLCQRYQYRPSEPVLFGTDPCDCPWSREEFSGLWQQRLDQYQERVLLGQKFFEWARRRGVNPSIFSRFGVDEDAGAFLRVCAKADPFACARLEAFAGFFSIGAIEAVFATARWRKPEDKQYLLERCLRHACSAVGTTIRLREVIFSTWLTERGLLPERQVPLRPHLVPAVPR